MTFLRSHSRKPKHQTRPCFPIRRQVSIFVDHLSSSFAIKFPINSVHVIKSYKIFTSSLGRCWKKASLQPFMILISATRPRHRACMICIARSPSLKRRLGGSIGCCQRLPVGRFRVGVQRRAGADRTLGCDALVVVLPDLSEELEPLGRFRGGRDEIVIEREGVEEPWGRRNRARTPVDGCRRDQDESGDRLENVCHHGWPSRSVEEVAWLQQAREFRPVRGPTGPARGCRARRTGISSTVR